jgi:hypothetical protein
MDTEAQPRTVESGIVTGAGNARPCVGVLFVHGAGDHGIGVTLVEFGEPLIAWLNGWLLRGKRSDAISSDPARTGATQIVVREGDAHSPAHSVVGLRVAGDAYEHTWLLAEARWDQAFVPPGFQQVLLWSIGVVPWTVLTQFIGPLARQAKFVERNPLSVGTYLLRVLAAAAAALIASAIVLTLALLILLLSLIPLDSVRNIVSRIQRFASAGVGDLYLVLTSPVQRAALSSAVQRDIDWLREQGCERVAVVAHSQGGYVAYQALTDPWHRPVELFVTFGSGLIRLTESERARRTSDLVMALIGTVGALIAIRFLPVALLGEAGIWVKRQADELAFAVGATVSLLLVLVLWRYFHNKHRVADLPTPIPWFDFLTTDDPVVNRRRKGLLPKRVNDVRTQNRGSLIADHSSYWQNGDQFVPQVAEQIGALDPGLGLMTAGPTATDDETKVLLEMASQRRRGRVSALRRRTNAVIVTTILVIGGLLIRPDHQLEAIGTPLGKWLGTLPSFLTSWAQNVILTILPIDGIQTIVLGALVIVILSGLAAWVGSQLWNRWSQFDTLLEYEGTTPKTSSASMSPAGVGFYAWTFLHLLVLVVVLVVGPATIIEVVGKIVGDLNQVVRAWGRQYVWTLLVGFVAFFWASSPGRSSVRSTQVKVIGGVALAMTLELIAAILAPGATPALLAIPAGLVIGIAAVLLVFVIWTGLQKLVNFVATFAEDDREQKAQARPPASVIDYLGFLGLLIALLAAFLVFVVPSGLSVEKMHLARSAAAIAALAFFFGLALAVNDHGYRVPRSGWRGRFLAKFTLLAPAAKALARMNRCGSSRKMQVVGVIAVILAAYTFLEAGRRTLLLHGPFD